MSKIQYIRDDSGKPLYVILPIEEYEKLVEVDEYGFRIEEDDSEEWQDVPYEKDDNDAVTIPFDDCQNQAREQYKPFRRMAYLYPLDESNEEEQAIQ